MVETSRSGKPCGVAALPLLQRLQSALGDRTKILELVREAEKGYHDDLHSLAEIYGVAVDVYGHAQSPQDYAFRDLCVKRMRTLCRLNPLEAREFHNRLRTYSIGRADARMYEARAAMEERLGDAAKAIKMLQEGLRVGAQPAEVLQRVLKRLQPADSLIPQGPLEAAAAAVPESNAASVTTVAGPREEIQAPLPSASSFQAVPKETKDAASAPLLQPLEPVAKALPFQPFELLTVAKESSVPVKVATVAPPATVSRPTTSATTAAASAPSLASILSPAAVAASVAAAARRGAHGASGMAGRPRILGLGDPMRRLPEESEPETDDDDEGLAPSSARSSVPHQEHFTSTVMSLLPLSPIKEIESPAKASSAGSARKAAESASTTPQNTPLQGGASNVPRVVASTSSGAPACPPSPVRSQTATPRQPADVSVDSAPSKSQRTSGSDLGKNSKVVYVNGVAYSQVQTIGRGGSSKVYLVQNPTGETYALKRVVTENAKQLEAFQNEVTLLQQLRDHEYVIQVVDAEVDREKGRINIVMEAGDMDLGRFLQSEPRLNLAQIQHLWRQMLEAVEVIHSERIVHSDLKPANFLLVNGRIKVIDFGIAKRISNDTTNISRDASVGTLSYMAPEAVKHGQLKLGRASDIWSLGIILYQMVYGQPPFAHLEPMQRLLKLSDPLLAIQFPPGHRLDNHAESMKANLKDVLSRCLQRDPRKRPSLPELLAHPFLSSSAEIRRDAVHGVVEVLMSNVLRTVASSLNVKEIDLSNHDWQVLADEVWEHLASSTDKEDTSPSRRPSLKAAGSLTLSGLEPLEELLQSCRQSVERSRPTHPPLASSAQAASTLSNENKGSMREKRTGAHSKLHDDEKENVGIRKPLAEVNAKVASSNAVNKQASIVNYR